MVGPERNSTNKNIGVADVADILLTWPSKQGPLRQKFGSRYLLGQSCQDMAVQ